MKQIKDTFKKIFSKVFKSNNPFVEIFQDNVEDRTIICPTDGYFLNKKQLKAILSSVKQLGECEFFISIAEYDDNFEKNSEHYIISSDITFNEYTSLPIYLENAIYSINGKWGIIISHENYALIGGTSDFMNKFKENYINWEDDICFFKEMWNMNKKLYNSDLSFISALEQHLKIDLSI